MAGISKTTLSYIEQGKTDQKYSTLEKISNALNVKIVIIE
jgi:transcriptional regulator with XRE-family HTH domain